MNQQQQMMMQQQQMNPQQQQMMMQNGGNGGMMNMAGGPMAMNRQVVNQNPMLGGTQYNDPGFAPALPFTEAVKKTPDHGPGRFVIPWDMKDHDFVYAACPNKVFRGKLTLAKLKQVIQFFFWIFF